TKIKSMKRKNLLSVLVIAVFVFLGLGSAVNKIHMGAFEYDTSQDKKSEQGNYIVKNDGTKVYGTKIKWKSGLFVKYRIGIDDHVFKINEVRGYQDGKTFYGRLGNEYIKRIVHGKINVYVDFTRET